MFDPTSLYASYQITISDELIDVMGHMNVMSYIQIFDIATKRFFSTFGITEEYVRNTNMGSFALEQHIRFLHEVRLGQQITVYTRVLARSDKAIHFIHFMMRDHDNTLAATSELVGAYANLTDRRTAPFPPQIAEKIDQYLVSHNKLDWDPLVCGVMGVNNK